jgi:hypothetical protein
MEGRYMKKTVCGFLFATMVAGVSFVSMQARA